MNRLTSGARILLWAALALAAAAPATVHADTFPSRPVHLVLPYRPGGIVDFVGRVLAQKLGDVLRQTVVAENRPGAGGIVGVDFVAHAAPDGYNIVIMDPAIVTNPTLQKSMPYDIFKDLVTISIVGSSPEVLVVAPQLGVEDLRGARGLWQSQSRQAQLRLRRRRHHAASCRRDVEAAHRHRGHARAL